MLKHIPNALTLIRLLLAPVIAWSYLAGCATGMVAFAASENVDARFQEIANHFTTAAVLFVVAALTDLFDGMAARAFNAHSKLGRIIDPIADKALVALPLLAIAYVALIGESPVGLIIACATAVIVIRDVTMTVIRLRSPDGEGARVSSLAKWKTALELAVIGSLLVVTAINAQMGYQGSQIYLDIKPYLDGFYFAWTPLLVITAALSAYTGWQYLRPAKKN